MGGRKGPYVKMNNARSKIMLGSEVRSWGWRHVRRQAEEWPTVWSKGKYSQN